MAGQIEAKAQGVWAWVRGLVLGDRVGVAIPILKC